MSMRERELESKGYVFWKSERTNEMAKARAAACRKHGWRATVVTETRNGVPYYLVYAKNNKEVSSGKV